MNEHEELNRTIDRLESALAAEREKVAELRAGLARMTAERDVALKAIAGDSKDSDCYLALLIALATNSTHELHPSHLENVLTATGKRKAEHDALADRVRGLEGALRTIDNNRGAETEDAYVLYRKLVNSANIARAALTPPAPQQEKQP